ncbi:MAG TPA: hypothetical protein VMW16_01905 [Sedimentisphaerales bacterium]|nr:hypothetical protein [Sedimentisphaerales bacterium]
MLNNYEQLATVNGQLPSLLYTCREPSTNSPFFAKQTQFPKGCDEPKVLFDKGLQKMKPPSTLTKTNPNKPNLLDTRMNLSSVKRKYYENEESCRRGQNKPNLCHRYQTQSQTPHILIETLTLKNPPNPQPLVQTQL